MDTPDEAQGSSYYATIIIGSRRDDDDEGIFGKRRQDIEFSAATDIEAIKSAIRVIGTMDVVRLIAGFRVYRKIHFRVSDDGKLPQPAVITMYSWRRDVGEIEYEGAVRLCVPKFLPHHLIPLRLLPPLPY